MKKFFTFVAALVLVTFSAAAGSFQYESFISRPYVSFQLTNGQTVSLTTSNINAFVPYRSYNSLPYASSQVFVTNSYVSPYWYAKNGGGYTNQSGGTNGFFAQMQTLYVNANGNPNAPALQDVKIAPDSEGIAANPNMALQVTHTGADAKATNAFVITVYPSSGGFYFDTNTTWSVYCTNLGASTITVKTNLPSWLVTGTSTLRVGITSNLNTNSSVYINELVIGSFVP